MNQHRRSSFSIDPSHLREVIRERWSPLTDDGGDLRARRCDEPEPRGRDEGTALAREETGST
jgi:hypothetical protein